MGHSRLYAFDARLISGTKEYQVGCDSLKQAKNFLSEKMVEVNGFKVDKVILWPQTSRARQMTGYGKDLILVDRNGVERYAVDEGNV